MKTKTSMAALTAVGAMLLWAGQAAAQRADGMVTIVPGPGYEAGSFKRALLGDNWRELWLTPLRVPLLDIGSISGGLTPEEQGGGAQSITLHLVDAEDREWIFRSVDKYPEQGLPMELRGSFFGDIVADQISALHPGSHFIMPRILDAAGLLHVQPTLYVMPDDPRLGEFRETFAGMLGELELQGNEGPDDTPGFAGSRKIKGSEEFLNDLEDSPGFRLNEREYLRARLIDMWVGDPDRGSDQWRWARFGEEGDYVYRPLPRDRDWAFVDADGPVAARFRAIYPKVLEFADRYPPIEALTYSSHALDRRLLAQLSRADFEAEAAMLQETLSDAVIAAAVGDMPPEFVPLAGASMIADLQARRAQLPAMAIEFHDWLAIALDVRGTDAPDLARVERNADGTVRIRLSPLSDDAAVGNDGTQQSAFFDRTFQPDETDEVRVYLHGDDDRALVTGTSEGPIGVRIIGGGGDDLLEDQTGAAHFYDHRGDNTFVTVSGTSVDTKSWEAPEPPEGFRLGSAWAPDYGADHRPFGLAVDYGEGAGVIIGGGPRLERYGFRRLPYKWHAEINALYATRSGGFGVTADGDYRLENSPLALTLGVRATQFDAFRFYGFGNDTPELDRDATLVMQDRVMIHPALVWHLGARPGMAQTEAEEEAEAVEEEAEDAESVFGFVRPEGFHGTFSIGPVAQWTASRIPVGSPLGPAREVRFGQAGGRAELVLDDTDQPAAPRRGYRVRAAASGFPATWDADGAFGSAAAEVNGYLPLVGETHLALRLGAERAFGEFPAFEAAFIGGRHSLRGFRSDRFAGDAAAFGGAELRVPIDTVEFIVNGELGVFGLVDAARVWFDGDSPDGWHSGYGGGLWFSAFERAFSVAYAKGERGRIYVWQGLPF
ncbi:MAG: BamA/TamA family outer membrane protein [Longimicrobiales bacterium]